MMDVRSEILAIAHTYLERVSSSGAENVMALCPFHDNVNSPSFAMNITNGVYFCHSCHAKGNLYTFLRGVGVDRQILELKYKELIEESRNWVPPGPDPMNPGVFDSDPIPESVLGNFDGYVIPQLLNAGFQEQTLRYFDVGYDKWHDRVTYPVRDIKGKLVGISGRAVRPSVKPRYKIYEREYELWGLPRRGTWDRRKILYNMHTTHSPLYVKPPTESYLIVVEGFKACMWLWQAGLKNVVATLGSYFSWEHRWLIERFCGRVYFLLDNNQAGRQGTASACEALLNAPDVTKANEPNDIFSACSSYVIPYPARLIDEPEAQPDSMSEEELWEQYLAAVPYSAWRRETEIPDINSQHGR